MKYFQSIIVCGLLLGTWFAPATASSRISPIPKGPLKGVYGVDMLLLGRLIEDRFEEVSEVRDMSDIKPFQESKVITTRMGWISFNVMTNDGILYEHFTCHVTVSTIEGVSLFNCGNYDARLSERHVYFSTEEFPNLIVADAEILY